MRVLHIAPGLGSGGVEKLIHLLCEQSDSTKFVHEIATPEPFGLIGDKLRAQGFRVHQLRPLREVGFCGYLRQMRRLLKEDRFDVVHSHMGLISPLVFIPAMCSGVKSRVLHGHTAGDANERVSPIRRCARTLIRLGCYWMATSRIACSRAAAEYLLPVRGSSRDKVRVIPNGINLGDFTPDEDKRAQIRGSRAAAHKFVVGHVGRFSPEKNQAFLLHIFSAVLHSRAESELWLVGTGPEKETLEELTRQLGIVDQVRFIEPTLDVASELAGMDAFVMPSTAEGLGLAVLEAQSMSLPCFVSTGVPREAIIGSNIEFLSLGDGAEEWAKRILEGAVTTQCVRRASLEGTPVDARIFVASICDVYSRTIFHRYA